MQPVKLGFAALSLVTASAALAQDAPSDSSAIVVIGDRAEQADVAADQAVAITLRQPIDTPLPRHYAPVCIKLFGINPAYGELLAERVRGNVQALGLPVGGADCKANIWIGFVKDSKGEVAKLRQREPAMFAELDRNEIKRIFGGSGAAQVWHATEIRSVDGRPIPIVIIPGDPPIEVKVNNQYQAGRLVSPVRNDINGTIVIFDRDRANGRSVQQLADYATFRILAPVQDHATVTLGTMPTILQLFTEGADAPDGLTEFDWAYLTAFYKLDRGAQASAVHDATKRAVLDGTGQRLREKSAHE